MAQARKKTSRGGRKTAGSRQTSARGASGRKSSGKKKTEKKLEADIKKELVILGTLAVSLLLFCANLGWCGRIGGALKEMQRGVFGIVGYLFPFYLFFLVCFLVSNGGKKRAVLRALVSLLVAAVLCGIVSLLAAGASQIDVTLTAGEYYEEAQTSLSGGVLGGLCLNLLYPALGQVGTYVVLLLLAAMGIVLVTERSILKPIGRGGKKVYDTARDDMARRHEIHAAKVQERKQFRAEKKVRGVSMDTDLEKERKGQDETRPADEKAEERESRAGEVPEVPEVQEEPLMAARVESTISELEAMDGEPAGENDWWAEEPEISYAEETRTREEDWPYEEPWSQEEPRSREEAELREEAAPPAQRESEKLPAGRAVSGSIFREAGSVRDSSGSVRFTDMSGDKEPARETAVKAEKPEKPEKPPRPYVKPPIRLLVPGKKRMKSRDSELKATAAKLQQTLRNFGVGVTVSNISCGPSVTRYELIPEQGVKVSRITALSDDIKLSLAAADVRIEAPIPGKSAVGIEVPNKENTTVFLRDVLESEEFMRFPSKLAFAVGRDIAGQIVVTDLAKMPHLLIAGATGSGKSVCINTLIMSIIYKADPSEVKLIMIDPKVVELSVYNGIPHLMIPVVTDPKKAAGALNWAVAEMTDRYKSFAQYNVRDLKGYNEKAREEGLPERPQVVIIVDELSDLMMVAPGEVEDAICRLAQMARAAGIHLVLATQRPSVNVITGLIKANVPSRIAFAVSSAVDSRTIIDMGGAEKLLGRGDMLFYPSGYQKPARVQGAFVSDDEVARVVKFLTDQGSAQYSAEVESRLTSETPPEGGGLGERDEYFAQAGRFLIGKEKGSIGMLQRAFKIGFNRAARIMDQLADAGVVGEEEGTKPRKILMTLEEFEEFLNQEP